MHWNSLSEFLAMGGYALYVWGSFGVAVALMAMEPCLARWRHTSIRRILARERIAEELDHTS